MKKVVTTPDAMRFCDTSSSRAGVTLKDLF
jgi:hypothetical protein